MATQALRASSEALSGARGWASRSLHTVTPTQALVFFQRPSELPSPLWKRGGSSGGTTSGHQTVSDQQLAVPSLDLLSSPLLYFRKSPTSIPSIPCRSQRGIAFLTSPLTGAIAADASSTSTQEMIGSTSLSHFTSLHVKARPFFTFSFPKSCQFSSFPHGLTSGTVPRMSSTSLGGPQPAVTVVPSSTSTQVNNRVTAAAAPSISPSQASNPSSTSESVSAGVPALTPWLHSHAWCKPFAAKSFSVPATSNVSSAMTDDIDIVKSAASRISEPQKTLPRAAHTMATTTSSSDPRPFDKAKMLELLRHVPMPVVVVTAAATEGSEHSASATAAQKHLVLRGITCSSFCSISMEPPLVSVCIQRSSPFLPLITSAQAFGVHVLHDGNKKLSSTFASKHPDLDVETFGSFAGVEWELFQVDSEGEGPSDAVPLLKGTRAALVCRKQGLHEYGDHFLLVGQVVAHADGEGHPLIYVNRQYRFLGDVV